MLIEDRHFWMTLVWNVYFAYFELLSLGQTSQFSPCILVSEEQAANNQSGYQACAPMHEGVIRFMRFIWENTTHDNILAFGTIMIAVFTYVLYRATNKLWDAGERQLAHLENTAQRQLRAYIVTKISEVRPPRSAPNNHVAVRITILNTGQTPAYKVRVASRTRLTEYPFPAGFDFTVPFGDDPSEGTLGPQEDVENDGRSDPMSEIEWGQLCNAQTGNQQLCTWGTVVYRDTFGKWQHTSFCVRHLFERTGPESSELMTHTCKEHNDAS